MLFLILIFSVFGCVDILKPPVNSNYGKVSLNLIDAVDADMEAPGTARTVAPSFTFTQYEYTFYKNGTGNGIAKTPDNEGYFTLEIDSYTVEVKAYIGEAPDFTLVASGVSELFTIGVNETVTVPLTVESGGQGTFDYTITWSGNGPANISITLQKWSDKSNVPLEPGNSQTLEQLDSGSYLLTVIVTQYGYIGGLTEVVHIYPGMTTTYVKDFDDRHLNFPTTLTFDRWSNGDIPEANGVQWFRFVATAETQLIHVEFGTLRNLYVQLYDTSGATVGAQTNLSNLIRVTPRTGLTIGDVYYIRVWPYDNGSFTNPNRGTYRIGFNYSYVPPEIVPIELPYEVWIDAVLVADEWQWFSFVPTEEMPIAKYLCFQAGSLRNVQIQRYNNSGTNPYGSEREYSDSNNNIGWSVSTTTPPIEVVGQTTWYMRVRPQVNGSSGTFRLGFAPSTSGPSKLTLPTENVVELEEGVWGDGAIPSGVIEQWFKFTATVDGAQYIHFQRGSLYDVNVQLYNSSGASVAGLRFYTIFNFYQSVTIGDEYYIQIRPYSTGGTGLFRVGFNASASEPVKYTIPPRAVTDLGSNSWADGNIVGTYNDQWYRFTATADTQYIHFQQGTLREARVRLYDTDGAPVGGETALGSTLYTSRTVTANEVYYIRVYHNQNATGDYKIGISGTSAPPPITLPVNVTELTVNEWTNCTISTGEEQWFKFTAPGSTPFIYFDAVRVSAVDLMQFYDNDGNSLGGAKRLTVIPDDNAPLTAAVGGNVYYFKVMQYTGTGVYKMGLSASNTPPLVTLPPSQDTTELIFNTWAENNSYTGPLSVNGEHWFTFTATAATQYIHMGLVSGGDGYTWGGYLQVYTNAGIRVGAGRLSNATASFSPAVVQGNQYYIRLSLYGGPTSTQYPYQVGFNDMFIPPGYTVTDIPAADTWMDGSLAGTDAQWFRFEATAVTQYIHSNGYLRVELFDTNGASVGGQTNLGTQANIYNLYTSRTLTIGNVYYIRATGIGGSDEYRIGFNALHVPPGIPQLSLDTWTESVMPANGTQWFKFTAPLTGNIYIHFGSSYTMGSVYMQMYDDTAVNISGNQENLFDTNSSAVRSVVTGQVYYIKITPPNSSIIGPYRIGLTTSSIAPPISAISGIIPITAADTWENGAITDENGREQWFQFTATVDGDQYIHFQSGGGIYRVSVQLYDSTGAAVGDRTEIGRDTIFVISRPVNSGEVYYIRVWPPMAVNSYGSTGTIRFAFNESATPPP